LNNLSVKMFSCYHWTETLEQALFVHTYISNKDRFSLCECVKLWQISCLKCIKFIQYV
jgi:hypothetical protein